MAFNLPPALRTIRFNTLLAALFSVLLIFFIVSHLIISSRRAGRERLFVVKADAVDAIAIATRDEKTVIVRSSGSYVFRSPYNGKQADAAKVRAYCEALAKLPVLRDLGAYDLRASTPFGITPNAARVTIEQGCKKTEAILGRNNPVEDQCYVYLPTRSVVVLTHLGARQLIEFPPEHFRDNQLLVFKPADIITLDIKRRSSAMVFKKEDSIWTVRDEPSGTTYVCDTRAVSNLLQALTTVAIEDFTPSDKNYALSTCGLDRPRLTMTVTDSSGTARGAALGGAYGSERVYAARGGSVAGGVPAQWVTVLSTQSTAYHRTYIIDFTPGRIASFTRAVKDEMDTYDKRRGKWFRTAKLRRPYDLEKMNMFLFYLSALNAERVFGEDELGPVEAAYVFSDKDGKQLLKLEIGGERDEYTKVRINGRGAVMGVSSEIARLMVL